MADRRPSRALADALACRSAALHAIGRIAEAAEDARRALAVARELSYPVGEVLALESLSYAASYAGDHDDAVGWPGRPRRSRPGSPARSPGRAATC